MIGFGLLWKKHPPENINMLYGYRTSTSMKSKETWDFAHKYTAKVWLFMSIPLCMLSAALLFAFKNSDISTFGWVAIIITGIQLAGLCLSIVLTEIELREKFDEKGNQR